MQLLFNQRQDNGLDTLRSNEQLDQNNQSDQQQTGHDHEPTDNFQEFLHDHSFLSGMSANTSTACHCSAVTGCTDSRLPRCT